MMRILVAGVGNIFLGDDAFGSEVALRLMQCAWPENVRIIDFGIRSYDLAYAMMDGYEVVILVDATSRGEPPGTVSLIEPDLSELDHLNDEPINAHSMNPVRVLSMVRSFGGQFRRLYLVGCEPAILESEELGLSEEVEEAVPRAIGMIESLIDRLLHEDGNAELNIATSSQEATTHGSLPSSHASSPRPSEHR